MARVPDQLGRGPDLHHPAEVHDGDPVGDEPRERQVVGDEQDADTAALAQLEHHPQDAAPERDVEHRHRLICDQHVRAERHGTRDRDTLPLAARQLVGELVAETCRRAQTCVVERLVDPRGPLPVGADGVDRQWLGHLIADAAPRIEALVGVLEDDLDAPSIVAQGAAADARDITALEQHLATGDGRQPDQGAPGGRLARSRLAHERHDLALAEAEGRHHPRRAPGPAAGVAATPTGSDEAGSGRAGPGARSRLRSARRERTIGVIRISHLGAGFGGRGDQQRVCQQWQLPGRLQPSLGAHGVTSHAVRDTEFPFSGHVRDTPSHRVVTAGMEPAAGHR